MASGPKQVLLNYLDFLKSSGFLYMEHGGADGELAAMEAAPAASKDSAVTARAQKGTMLSREERTARFEAALAKAEACRACALGAGRGKLVYASGDPMAKLVFVGEAPGEEEDLQGLPFVGRSGQLLDKMLKAIGFERDEVYVCNTLKCRPPHNRDPLPGEKDACEGFLVEQLEILQPSVLVALGSHAAQYLCRSDLPIGKLRGTWHTYHGIPLRATYHPAFLLRSPGMKTKAWDDFQAIHAKYCELNPGEERTIWKKD